MALNLKYLYMKKLLRLACLVLAAAALLQLASCKKILDRYFHDHGGDGGDSSSKVCRIDSITNSETSEAMYFSYYEDGRPKSVRHKYEDFDYWNFIYNDQKQLIQVLEYGTLKHSYHYTGDRITEDTTVEIGEIWLHKPVYDGEGRVAADTLKILFNATDQSDHREYVTTYDYDSNGNLQPPAPWPAITTYDNKVNALRTNDTWLFLTRDYSKNNKQEASQYNSEGLPVKFDSVYVIPGFAGGTDIYYHCE